MRFRLKRKSIWTIAVAVATAVVVVLLALIGLGYLIIPQKSPAPYTVTSVNVTVLQGTNPGGQPWINGHNSSSPPYPMQFTPGSSFVFAWQFICYGTNLSLNSIVAHPPFSYGGASPALPNYLNATDRGLLRITIGVPDTPGGTGAVQLVVTVVSIASTG